jgi:hypothetical protein
MLSLPITSNCHLGDGDVVWALRYHLVIGVCPASMQDLDKPLTREGGKPVCPGQAMRPWCRCWRVCHDVAFDCGWRACAERSAQASTNWPACRVMMFLILL